LCASWASKQRRCRLRDNSCSGFFHDCSDSSVAPSWRRTEGRQRCRPWPARMRRICGAYRGGLWGQVTTLHQWDPAHSQPEDQATAARCRLRRSLDVHGTPLAASADRLGCRATWELMCRRLPCPSCRGRVTATAPRNRRGCHVSVDDTINAPVVSAMTHISDAIVAWSGRLPRMSVDGAKEMVAGREPVEQHCGHRHHRHGSALSTPPATGVPPPAA
jgi:hypothetical protein